MWYTVLAPLIKVKLFSFLNLKIQIKEELSLLFLTYYTFASSIVKSTCSCLSHLPRCPVTLAVVLNRAPTLVHSYPTLQLVSRWLLCFVESASRSQHLSEASEMCQPVLQGTRENVPFVMYVFCLISFIG